MFIKIHESLQGKITLPYPIDQIAQRMVAVVQDAEDRLSNFGIPAHLRKGAQLEALIDGMFFEFKRAKKVWVLMKVHTKKPGGKNRNSRIFLTPEQLGASVVSVEAVLKNAPHH